MKKQLLIAPAIFFAIILSSFFYLLLIDRNPSEIPSNLLNKNVPVFETESLFSDKRDAITDPAEPEPITILSNFFICYQHPF